MKKTANSKYNIVKPCRNSTAALYNIVKPCRNSAAALYNIVNPCGDFAATFYSTVTLRTTKNHPKRKLHPLPKKNYIFLAKDNQLNFFCVCLRLQKN
jgi:hypothetical protein